MASIIYVFLFYPIPSKKLRKLLELVLRIDKSFDMEFNN